MIYFLVLVGVCITSVFCEKSIKINKTHINGALVYTFFWTIILVCICGLRNTNIGRDTNQYFWSFLNIQNRSSLQEVFGSYNYFEYGFYFIEFFISRFFSYQVLLFVCAILSIVPVMIVIYRYSENMAMSLFLYVSFPYYTFCFSGLRQACAIGMIMLAYISLRENKKILFIIFNVLGILFHSSAFLFLPVILIAKIPYNKVVRFWAIVLMAFIYVFRSILWQFVLRFARQQYGSNDAGGRLMYVFMILTVILGFYYWKKKAINDENIKLMLYFQIIAVMLWPVASMNSALARMYYYYHIFIILYVPSLMKTIDGKVEKITISSGYYLVAVYFLVSQILPESQKINPYYFYWQ